MLLSLLAGIAILVFAAERAVGHAERVSEKLGVSPVIIGALVVGLGTSLPEMVVSGVAAAQRDTIDIAVGNLVGSNAANLTLVLGTGALIVPVRVRRAVFLKEGSLMLAAAMLVAVFLLDDELSRLEGGVLLAGMVIAAGIISRASVGAEKAEVRVAEVDHAGIRTAVVRAVVALAGVVIGAQFLVRGAVDLADSLGASEAFIGLTVVAIGTSLPELATTIACARRGSVELIIGSVFGSNIFNSFAVGGVAGIVGSGDIAESPTASVAFMLGLTALVLGAGILRGAFSRIDGTVLLACYPVIVLAGL